MLRRTTLSAAALALVAAGGLFTAAGQANAVGDAPSFDLTWGLGDDVIHEYEPYYPRQVAGIENTSDVPLTISKITFMGKTYGLDSPERGKCTPVVKGVPCPIFIYAGPGGIDHTAHPTFDVVLTVEVTAPDGTTATRTVTETRPVVDDKPTVNQTMRPTPGQLTAGQPLGVCWGYGGNMHALEPTELVGAHSQLLGDLLDPANPKIATRDKSESCKMRWISTVVPEQLPLTDTITVTVADNEGNRVSEKQRITWQSATPTPPAEQPTLVVTSSVDRTSVPETGATVHVTTVLHNDGKAPLNITALSTRDGRDLLAGTHPATCTGDRTIAPQGILTCAYDEQVSGWARQIKTVGDVTATGTQAGQEKPVTAQAKGIAVNVTDVKPKATLRLSGPSAGRAGSVVTLKATLTGKTSEPISLKDAGFTPDTQLVSSTCELATEITDTKPYSCELGLRLSGERGTTVPVSAWAKIADDDGNEATATASKKIAIR